MIVSLSAVFDKFAKDVHESRYYLMNLLALLRLRIISVQIIMTVYTQSRILESTPVWKNRLP